MIELCLGTFLVVLKYGKSPAIKQNRLGRAIYGAIQPDSNVNEDDSAISALFCGKRNLNNYLQLDVEDIDPKVLSLNFMRNVIPLLDENKRTLIVRLLQMLIEQDSIDEETHVELVNKIKKKDLVHMDEVVFEEFITGVFLYTVKNTNNLHKEKTVKEFKSFFRTVPIETYKKVDFIPQYLANTIFNDNLIRPNLTLYKQGSTIIDVVAGDVFEIARVQSPFNKINIIIPVNTSFETRIETRVGNDVVSLVSENTIHGQWINYMKKQGESISDIDLQILRSLNRNQFFKCGVRDTNVGKQNVYPMASVALVSTDRVKYYLLALSEFDKKNKAQSSKFYIEKAIDSVIDYYDIEGQGFDLYIPLVGSGRSRAGLSLQESYELIRKIILLRKNEIYGRVHIVIHHSQIDQVNLEV